MTFLNNKRTPIPFPLPYGYMTKSALQNIPTGVSTKILFDVMVNAYRVSVDLTNHQFIVQEEGIYTIGFWGTFTANNVGYREWDIIINGVAVYQYPVLTNGTIVSNRIYGIVSEPTQLNVGDIITFNAIQTSGGNLAFNVSGRFPSATLLKLSNVQ